MVHQKPGNIVLLKWWGVGWEAKQDSESHLLESSALPMLAHLPGCIPFLNHVTLRGSVENCHLPNSLGAIMMGTGQETVK